MSWILKEIAAREGKISFHDFMELALYHPDNGYYSSGRPRYGRGGDFLTAPTASRWYALVLATLLSRLAHREAVLCLVDCASGDGTLLSHLLSDLRLQDPGRIRVVSVERSAAMQRLQQQRLAGSRVPLSITNQAPKLDAEAQDLVVLHASELYDALPVHRVIMHEAGLCELWVTIEDSGLSWSEQPAPPSLQAYLDAHHVTLQPGQRAEINLACRPLHAELLGGVPGAGVAITLDYGYEAHRLYNPRGRFGGSLACYRQHRLSRDPLADPGEQDITAHICWDDLRTAGVAAGWREVALLPLAELLVRGGLESEMQRLGLGMEAELTAETVGERQEIKRLLDPEGMGSDLRALVQATPDAVSVVKAALGL